MTTQVSNSETRYLTWSPFITREDVQKITRKATPWQKFRLLFRRSKYSFDSGAIIRYKEMDNIVFVMKRGTHL